MNTFIFISNALAAPSIPNAHVAVNTGILDAILSASLVVQITLATLVALSIVCWAVGLAKFRQFGELKLSNTPFNNLFWRSKSFDQVYQEMDRHKLSNLGRVFRAGYEEIRSSEGLADFHSVERALRKAIDNEIGLMESKLTLLATTGSTGPFIGLFGTVWGIMGSFHKIGATGSASLAVVAPGISEALITTAIGLAAAIPAVVLYNNFVAKIRRNETDLNNFATDFLNQARKQKLVSEV